MLVAGFPNYMVQEAFAGAPITFITGGSQTTATDAVRMCFGETDVDEIGDLTTITNWSIDVSGGTTFVALTGGTVVFNNNNASCTGTTDSVTITGMETGSSVAVSIAVDGAPNLRLADVNVTHNSLNEQTAPTEGIASDGIAPTVVSAATTSSTTIVLTMTEAMTNNAAVAGDFTIGGVASTPTVTDLEVAGTSITLTLNAEILNTDTATVTYNGDADDLEDASNNDLADFSNQAVTNNVAAPSGGSHLGCAGDCTSPTIGLDKYGIRSVDGGFSYNSNTVDVIAHHTPFPLISAQIGKTNTVVVKVYDEYGTQGLRLVQFGLGLPEIGSPLGNAEAIIAIWYEYGGNNIDKVTITDKHNLIENSSVTTQTKIVDCREGSADQCTQLTMKYMYREASIYNVMRVNVMDSNRNLQTSTFNDGVEVLGESMNPADKLNIIPVTLQQYPQKRGLVELTQIDRSEKLWTDPYGYIWQGDQSKMVLLSTIPLKEPDNDPISVFHGYNDRINSNFASYKQEQIDKAQEIFDILYMEIQVDDPTDYVAETNNFTYKNRINDSVLQQALIDEANRAELVLEELLSKTHRVNMVND